MTQIKLYRVAIVHTTWYTSYLSQSKIKRREPPIFFAFAPLLPPSSVLPIFDIRCSCQLVNSNRQVGVAARNIEFGDNLANFDSSSTLNLILGSIPLNHTSIPLGIPLDPIKYSDIQPCRTEVRDLSRSTILWQDLLRKTLVPPLVPARGALVACLTGLVTLTSTRIYVLHYSYTHVCRGVLAFIAYVP